MKFNKHGVEVLDTLRPHTKSEDAKQRQFDRKSDEIMKTQERSVAVANRSSYTPTRRQQRS